VNLILGGGQIEGTWMAWIGIVVAWLVVSPLAALLFSKVMRDRRPPAPVARPLEARPRPTDELTDATVVVTAHGLASSCGVVVGGSETLREGWDDMSPDQRDEILGMVIDQARLVQQVLVDLTRGVAADVQVALDQLERPFSLPSDVDGRAARP
jgi:hypothetical protein